MTKTIIGVCGFKRSGKDTIADYIVSHYGFTKLRFADPLKQMCKHLFDFIDDQLESDLKEAVDERWGCTPRKAMQFLGTEIMQYKINELLPGIDRGFWVKKMINTINHTPSDNIIISDLRFLHEYYALKEEYKNDFKVIKIYKDHGSRFDDSHASEVEWRSIPHEHHVNNDSSIADLYTSVDTILKSNQS